MEKAVIFITCLVLLIVVFFHMYETERKRNPLDEDIESQEEYIEEQEGFIEKQ